jgi:preprotein translocase subunit SecY
MFKTLINIFRVPELRNKVLFTLFMLAIYRVGYHVPLPGVDQSQFRGIAEEATRAGRRHRRRRLASYVSLFSGGNLSQSTIFGLGVMPYISASIIFQLLGTVVPSLEKMQKEGETGRKKIQEWTSYATVPLAIIQGVFWLSYMHHPALARRWSTCLHDYIQHCVLGHGTERAHGRLRVPHVARRTDRRYGLGNGVSLIILAGIVARMPSRSCNSSS